MLKCIVMRGGMSYAICVVAQTVVMLICGICGATQMVTPEFAARVGNPLVATALQILLIGCVGCAFGTGSLLFEVENGVFSNRARCI